VQGAPVAREVVLVLDQDDSGLCGVDIHGGLPCAWWYVECSASDPSVAIKRWRTSSAFNPRGRRGR
jgi:hypothetical protein